MARLKVAQHIVAGLRELAMDGYPEETCGLLVGRELDGVATVESARQARNIHTERTHDRYELDPKDFLATMRSAASQGLEIIGVWHSHPDHPAVPSETDRLLAWPNWHYLILSVTGDDVPDLRSWTLAENKQFIEDDLEL